MTTVTIGRDVTGFIRTLKAQGHSGFAQEGEDIVCAAVSALTQTAAMAAEDFGGITRIEEEPPVLSLELKKSLSASEMHDVQTILEAIVRGLEAVQEQYPAFLTIREV